MTRPFPITRLVLGAGLLIVRGFWALPWWLMVGVGFVVALLMTG
jgi:hypothetical protein